MRSELQRVPAFRKKKKELAHFEVTRETNVSQIKALYFFFLRKEFEVVLRELKKFNVKTRLAQEIAKYKK